MSGEFAKLKVQIRKLKLILIVLTIVQLTTLILSFCDFHTWTKLDGKYNINTIITIFQFSLAGLLIWFLWRKMPGNKKSKTNNTLMIIFLGVIGMWLWIPNKRQLKNLEASYESS